VTLARRPLGIALAIALCGLAVALWLARLHVTAHAGESSICDINAVVNCDKVATSSFSVVLGLPVAVWGAFGYALAAILAGWGLARRRPHATWPAGFLFLIGAVAAATVVPLAIISEAAIGAVCLFCMASWALSIALFVTAWRIARPVGVGAAVRADLRAAAARPGWALLVVAGLAALLAVLGVAYPRYWESHPPAEASPDGGQPALALPPAERPSSPDGALTVVEYSDYECPYCAKAHAVEPSLFGGRSDVKLVRKHFPLDQSCNPAISHPMHLASCSLAIAAICAGEQGKFHEMDDALFANQQLHLPLEEIVQKIGLDKARFEACRTSPSAASKLASDIRDGIRDQIHGTPTYMIGSQAYSLEDLPRLLPPRP
jgi:uncharacterized membrane protein